MQSSVAACLAQGSAYRSTQLFSQDLVSKAGSAVGFNPYIMCMVKHVHVPWALDGPKLCRTLYFYFICMFLFPSSPCCRGGPVNVKDGGAKERWMQQLTAAAGGRGGGGAMVEEVRGWEKGG